MYRSIIVPLDSSAFSEAALPIARAMVRHTDATLRLVHVHVPAEGLPIDGIPFVDSQLDQASRAHERSYLEGLQQRLMAEVKRPTTVALLDGPVAAALVEEIRVSHADLVLMTTHGRSGLTRVWLGSVADTLIHHVTVPLLLLRPQETVAPPEPVYPMRRIMIPLDGSLFAEQIIDCALELDTTGQTEYILFQVVQPFVRPGYSHAAVAPRWEYAATMQRQKQAQRYLDALAQRLRAAGRRVRTQIACEEQPAVVILEHAREQRVDLIAMATHGSGGPARFLVGSIADKVLRGANCPVLLYRPRELVVQQQS